MAHIVENECVCCALCTEVCAVHCIHEDDQTFVVDSEACTECGDCLPICPVQCIIGDPKAAK